MKPENCQIDLEVKLINQSLFSLNCLERINALILLSKGQHVDVGWLVEGIIQYKNHLL